MYLFLVDYNFISSEQLQKMIGKIIPEADIVNCFSTGTLLKITEKLKPDIIIIDFDLVDEDQKDLIQDLRSISTDAHILALIDPDYYEKLYEAIEFNAIDDYMVKPIRNEDFMARIYIATRRKGLAVDDYYKPPSFNINSSDLEPRYLDSEEEHEDTSGEVEFVNEVISEIGTTKFASKVTEGDDGNNIDSETEDVFTVEEKVDSPYADMYEEDDYFTLSDEKLEEVEEIEEPNIFADEEESNSEVGQEDTDFASLFSSDDNRKVESTSEDIQEEPFYAVSEDEDFELTSKNDGHINNGDDPFDWSLSPEETGSSKTTEESITDLFKETELESTEEAATNSKDIIEPNTKEFKDEWDFSEDIFENDQGFEEQKVEFEYDSGSVKESTGDTVNESDKSENNNINGYATEEKKVFQENYFDDLFSEEPIIDDRENKNGSSALLFEEDISSTYSSEKSFNNKSKPSSDLPGESADQFLYGERALDKAVNNNYNEEEFEKDLFAIDDQGEFDFQNRAEKKKKSGNKISRFFSTLGNGFFVLVLLMMAVLSIFLIQSRISGGVPQVAGYQMYIVLSGSMSPEFDTGSLAFVKETDPLDIVVGDIITFRSQSGSDTLTTHRVVEVLREDGLSFVTRGDANNVNDPNPVPAENVVGTVTGSVPYVGYLMNFVQTRAGLILLIFVPGVLIILFELGKIIKYMKEGDDTNKKKGKKKYSQTAEDFD